VHCTQTFSAGSQTLPLAQLASVAHVWQVPALGPEAAQCSPVRQVVSLAQVPWPWAKPHLPSAASQTPVVHWLAAVQAAPFPPLGVQPVGFPPVAAAQ
jgi:hypothetical protein